MTKITELKVENAAAAKQKAGASFAIEPTLKEAQDDLREQWMRRNLNIEIAIDENARIIHDPVERKIAQYSLSSRKKRGFFQYVLRATFEGTTCTVTQLTKLLGTSRNTVELIVKDCTGENWITVTRCSKGHKHMTANENLINCYRNYCKWLWEQVNDLGLKDISYDLGQIKDLQERMLSN